MLLLKYSQKSGMITSKPFIPINNIYKNILLSFNKIENTKFI